MGIYNTNKPVLDTYDGRELVLEILSFSGGENTIAEDQAVKSNEARILENWDANSLGGMERTEGINLVASGNGSGLLDGTGDFFSLADSADWDFSGGTWTVDLWLRPTGSLISSRMIWSQSTDANNMIYCFYTTNGVLTFSIIAASATVVTMSSASSTIVSGNWHHIAIVESGNNYFMFVNGTQVATTSDTDRPANYTGTFRIGQNAFTGNLVIGNIDEFRISNTARWTSGFTPSTTAYTPDSNTKLLIHFTGTNASTSIIDFEATPKTVTANGDAKIDTSISKFGLDQPSDLLIQHKDSGGTELYTLIEGHLFKKSGTSLVIDDQNAFTSGVLSTGISSGSALWITNSTDNLRRKTVGNIIATPASVPTTACARIYNHKNRLVAEGSGSVANRIYGSRTGSGNWTAADAWSLSNDAWSIDLPDDTRGCQPNFPSGNEILAFTETNCYALSNFPNTAFRPISIPGRGCSAPLSIALGDEGVYFVSRRPTLGVFLFNGTEFTELTPYNHDVFVDLIDFTKRIYGFYSNHKYHLIYNELNSGVSYPNRMRIYDARFGRWMNRPINLTLGDNLGYPAILQYSNYETYTASSLTDKIYEFGIGDDDEGNDTQAVYQTKDFSSRDWSLASGGQFPIDDVRLKLIKAIVTYYGTTGALGLQWSSDRGKHSGSKTFSLNANGDLINSTFIVNTSLVVTTPPDLTTVLPFSNDAVGRRFNFQVTNSGQSTRPKIKKIKVHAVSYDES